MVPISMNRLNIVCKLFAENNAFHLVNSMYRQLDEYLIHATFDRCACYIKTKKILLILKMYENYSRTYALKSCLLINTALIPVSTAIILRYNNPYRNEKNVEFKKTDGKRSFVTLSNHKAQINCGCCFRS